LKKILFRILTSIFFTVSGFLILQPFSWSVSLTSSFLLFLGFTIVFSAIYFSVQAVIVFGALSLSLILLHSLRVAEFSSPAVLLILAIVSICYSYCLKVDKLTQKVRAEFDNIDEENNILDVEVEHLRLETSALKQKLRRHTTLKDLTENFSSIVSLDELIPLIAAEALRIVGKTNNSLLYLVDRQKQELKLVGSELVDSQRKLDLASVHKAGVKLKKGDIFDNWVFKQRVPLLVEDTRKDFRFNVDDVERNSRAVRSLISVPLIRKNRLVGILRLNNEAAKTYDTDDLRLLSIVSDLAAVAVENALLYQKMQQLAITDGLSGLFVHRYFMERLDEEIKRTLWMNSQFAFLMIDIDDFKRYNDQYGHIAGDIVLKQIAKLISGSVNPGDIVGRYGGEEFAVLMLDTSRQEATKMADDIRRCVEEKDFILRRKKSKVTISGGLCLFPEGAKAKEQLIQKADQALYKAKAEGKNRICIS